LLCAAGAVIGRRGRPVESMRSDLPHMQGRSDRQLPDLVSVKRAPERTSIGQADARDASHGDDSDVDVSVIGFAATEPPATL